MNREETKAAIAVMQAFADGKQIQYVNKNDPLAGSWVDCEIIKAYGKSWQGEQTVKWNWSICNYRVKPEVVRYRVALSKQDTYLFFIAHDKESETAIEKLTGFDRWLAEWQEVEV